MAKKPNRGNGPKGRKLTFSRGDTKSPVSGEKAVSGRFIDKNSTRHQQTTVKTEKEYKIKGVEESRENLKEAIKIFYGHTPESHMTSLEKMETTRTGISKEDLEQLKSKAGLDYDQLAHILGVARNTLISKKGTEKFPAALGEKIMSLADIYSYGYEVFGGIEEFNKWILEPVPALGNKPPYDFLDNQFGREEVRNIIGRIDYGVYS